MNILVTRKIYETQCKEYKTSPYKGLREYAGYLDRFFYSNDIVDGMSFEERSQKLPMPISTFKEVVG